MQSFFPLISLFCVCGGGGVFASLAPGEILQISKISNCNKLYSQGIPLANCSCSLVKEKYAFYLVEQISQSDEVLGIEEVSCHYKNT